MQHDPTAQGDDTAPADDFFQFDGAAAPSGAVAGVDDAPRVPPRLGLLADLSSEDFDLVARAAKLAFVPAETVLFDQGDEADRFFILVDGAVEVVRDGESLATLGPGSFFGESALLVRGRRSAQVRTISDSAVWSISYEAFDAAVSHQLLAHEDAGAETRRRIAATPDEAFHPGD